MLKLKAIYALLGSLAIATAVPGCAVYEKCGLHGCPGDANIAANVRALISQHPSLRGGPDKIDVQSLDHVVYLHGTVSTGLQRQTAESVALEAPGVVRVVNDIAITR
jgi:osmotically-inducible protein OsmY